jgi:hypothetical protein
LLSDELFRYCYSLHDDDLNVKIIESLVYIDEVRGIPVAAPILEDAALWLCLAVRYGYRTRRQVPVLARGYGVDELSSELGVAAVHEAARSEWSRFFDVTGSSRDVINCLDAFGRPPFMVRTSFFFLFFLFFFFFFFFGLAEVLTTSPVLLDQHFLEKIVCEHEKLPESFYDDDTSSLSVIYDQLGYFLKRQTKQYHAIPQQTNPFGAPITTPFHQALRIRQRQLRSIIINFLLIVLPTNMWEQIDASGKSASQIADELGLELVPQQLREKSKL